MEWPISDAARTSVCVLKSALTFTETFGEMAALLEGEKSTNSSAIFVRLQSLSSLSSFLPQTKGNEGGCVCVCVCVCPWYVVTRESLEIQIPRCYRNRSCSVDLHIYGIGRWGEPLKE